MASEVICLKLVIGSCVFLQHNSDNSPSLSQSPSSNGSIQLAYLILVLTANSFTDSFLCNNPLPLFLWIVGFLGGSLVASLFPMLYKNSKTTKNHKSLVVFFMACAGASWVIKLEKLRFVMKKSLPVFG